MPMNDVVIENLAFGGFGVGTSQGKKVFIPYTIPGERVTFSVTKAQKRFDWGRLEEILEPSPFRRKAPCPYFGDCGGCQWQHIEDAAQTRFKEKLFQDTLFRLGNVEPERVRPLIAAPDPFHYRSRITLHRLGGALGFYAANSNRVAPIENCIISDPKINETLRTLIKQTFLPENAQVEIAASPGEPEVMISCRAEKPLLREQRVNLVRSLGGLPQVKAALVEDSTGADELYQGAKGLRFQLPSGAGRSLEMKFLPGVFFQVNWAQNIRLLELVLKAVEEIGSGLNILELHSGAGNFTVPVAAAGHAVCSVEQNKRAVANAGTNMERNHVTGVETRAGDTAAVLKAFAESGRRFDLIITDPPRGGIKEETESLLRLQAPHLLYVSCDPATLARDIRTLEQGGYRLASSQPFDFFPQTYHIESLNYLVLRS